MIGGSIQTLHKEITVSKFLCNAFNRIRGTSHSQLMNHYPLRESLNRMAVSVFGHDVVDRLWRDYCTLMLRPFVYKIITVPASILLLRSCLYEIFHS